MASVVIGITTLSGSGPKEISVEFFNLFFTCPATFHADGRMVCVIEQGAGMTERHMGMGWIIGLSFAVDLLMCRSFFLMHGYIKNYVARNNRFEILGWVYVAVCILGLATEFYESDEIPDALFIIGFAAIVAMIIFMTRAALSLRKITNDRVGGLKNLSIYMIAFWILDILGAFVLGVHEEGVLLDEDLVSVLSDGFNIALSCALLKFMDDVFSKAQKFNESLKEPEISAQS